MNLESHKKAKSSILKVLNKDGVLVTDPKKVLLQYEIEKFCSDLYKATSLAPSDNSLTSFLENLEIPKLTANDAQVCEGKLTVAECLRASNYLKTTSRDRLAMMA